jgi:hypothetical protein
MKKSILLIAIALVSVSIMAQNPDRAQKRAQKQENSRIQTQDQTPAQDGTQIRTQDQERAQTRNEAALHGENVSTTAQTESGPDKGEVVSQQARTRGETKKAQARTSARDQNSARNNGARANSAQRTNMKMSKGTAPGRK